MIPCTLIIDPPVGPFSDAAAIEAWLERLKAMRADNDRFESDAMEAVERAVEEAARWLERAR
jgi:hypothetical protein